MCLRIKIPTINGLGEPSCTLLTSYFFWYSGWSDGKPEPSPAWHSAGSGHAVQGARLSSPNTNQAALYHSRRINARKPRNVFTSSHPVMRVECHQCITIVIVICNFATLSYTYNIMLIVHQESFVFLNKTDFHREVYFQIKMSPCYIQQHGYKWV